MNDIKWDDRGETAAKSDQTPLAVLVRGAEKTIENAERFFSRRNCLRKRARWRVPFVVTRSPSKNARRSW